MTTIDLKIQRSNCFKLLAACFYEPDRDLFLQEKLCDNLVSLFSACECSAAADSARNMLVALSKQNSEDLKIEYSRLFVGPFELIAPPYGSVYLEKTRRLMGDSTIAVSKFYEDAGLSLDVKDAPDHIAFELEFMHYLCLAEIEAEAENRENDAQNFIRMQSDFMERFLMPWIPAFCESIRGDAGKGFYNNLAECLEAFIDSTGAYYKTSALEIKNENNDACRATA